MLRNAPSPLSQRAKGLRAKATQTRHQFMNPYPSKPIAPWQTAAVGALFMTLAALTTGCPRMHAPPPKMVAPTPPPKQDSPAPLPEPEPKRPQNPLRAVPDNACKDDRMEIVDILPIDNRGNVSL